jgi:hypothetical protein
LSSLQEQLPKPIVREIVKEVKTFVTIDVALFGPKAPVLRMDEYERRAIIHALKRCKKGIAAARALGIGKTTLYRKLAEYKIDAASYLKYAKRGRKAIRCDDEQNMHTATESEPVPVESV